MSHISALCVFQSKFAAQMKVLGEYNKQSKEESQKRQLEGRTIHSHPVSRWGWWVLVKVKRREYSINQAILQDLKRDREARDKAFNQAFFSDEEA